MARNRLIDLTSAPAAQGQIVFRDNSNAKSVTIQGPPAVTGSSYTLGLPAVLTTGLMKSDVSGTLSLAPLVDADVAAGAAIAYSKLALTGTVVNADISASAAIVYSKLNLATSIVNADISASAAIAYSKLALTGTILNADINAGAAIAYSKLNLATSIVNADIAAAAAIARTKIASGSINHVVINDGSGVLSSEAQLAISRGGTGAGSKAAAFDALSPMTTSGDIIYGGASGTGTRLAKGTDGFVLSLTAGIPSWIANTASAPTNTYFEGYLENSAANDWITASATYAALTTSGTSTLTARRSNGITVTAAASNGSGITFTPSGATAVYLVTMTTNIFNATSGGGMSLRLYDGSVVAGTAPSYSNSASSYNFISITGVYAPATASAVTLSVQGLTNAGTARIGLSSGAVPGWFGIEWKIVQIK